MLVKEKCDSRGDAVLLVTSTLRTNEEQARLYRRGRSFAIIQVKAEKLEFKWHRPDLADVLLDVGAQSGYTIDTNAGPGQSLHNYGLAVACVPVRDGKCVWGSKDPEDRRLWELYGECAVEVGLEWAGNWRTFKEFPHVQLPGVRWQDLIVRREVRTVGV